MSRNKEYGWIIVRDFADVGAKGIMSRNSPFSDREIRSRGELFRILDDDGNLYFHAKILGEYTGFEPLDEFAMPATGATYVEYKDRSGEWRVL